MKVDLSPSDLRSFAADVGAHITLQHRCPASGGPHTENSLLRRLFARRMACWRAWPPVVEGQRPWQRFLVWLDRFFEVSARGSTLPTELRAGCVSFMTMSYMMLVNPVLLYKAGIGDTLSFEALLTATALASTIGSLLAGVLGNAPVGLIPGLRLNAYFTFGFCHTLSVSWGEALSCCFVSGALLLLLAVLGVSDWIVRTILTDHLKKASAVAMGIFQAMIGLQMMGFVVAEQDAMASLQCMDGKLITLASVQCSTVGVTLALGTFCMLSCLLVSGRTNGVLLIGICTIAAGSWISGLASPPKQIFAAPRFDVLFSLDFVGWLRGTGKMVVGTSVMLFVALFDIAGVKYGLYSIAGLLKHGGVPQSRGIIASTAIGTMVGALLGTSPLVIANESSAGIMEGARTGLTAIVVAILFALSAFIAPLLTAIPDLAAAAPLVLTGAFMMEPSRGIAWNDLRVAIPSFVTIMLMPLSIHRGISAGIFLDVILGLMTRISEVAGATKREDTPATPARAERQSFTPLLEKRLPMPHSFVFTGNGLKETEKVERVRQLLHDLGPPCTGMQASETWEIALRQGLETYLDGMCMR